MGPQNPFFSPFTNYEAASRRSSRIGAAPTRAPWGLKCPSRPARRPSRSGGRSRRRCGVRPPQQSRTRPHGPQAHGAGGWRTQTHLGGIRTRPSAYRASAAIPPPLGRGRPDAYITPPVGTDSHSVALPPIKGRRATAPALVAPGCGAAPVYTGPGARHDPPLPWGGSTRCGRTRAPQHMLQEQQKDVAERPDLGGHCGRRAVAVYIARANAPTMLRRTRVRSPRCGTIKACMHGRGYS